MLQEAFCIFKIPSGLLWPAEFMDIAPRALAFPGPPVEGAPTAIVTLNPSPDEVLAANLNKTEAEPRQPKALSASVSVEDHQPDSSPAQDPKVLPSGNPPDPGELLPIPIFSHFDSS